MAAGYLIRIPKRKDRVRAIQAFMEVPKVRHVFTDYRMLVTPEHIEVLKREGIPFEDLTDSPTDTGLDNGKSRKQNSRKVP